MAVPTHRNDDVDTLPDAPVDCVPETLSRTTAMAPPDEPLAFTSDACLRALGLDPSTRHDASSIDRAYRQKLFSNHPDTSGVAGSPESLNRVIHARNMLSSGSFGSHGRAGRYAPSSDGYTPMSDAYSREEFYRWRERRWGGDKVPIGLWRFRTLGFRSFAGNVRLGLGAAFMATACTLAWARHTEKRRKKERSPRLRAAMGLRADD